MNQVFLSGENIDLCVPSEADFPTWASWFNSQKITEFLEQGKFPNTVEMQREFLFEAQKAGRFLALIKTKKDDLIGVVSLSEINYERRCCQVSYVCPSSSAKPRFSALEALALVTQHAFDRLDMEYVWCGHSYPGLENWIRKTELLGYRTNGFFEGEFKRGSKTSNAVRCSITKTRYLDLLQRRNDSLWPGEEKIAKMIASINSDTSLAQKLGNVITDLHGKLDRKLKELELNANL
jgi:hypothetical protein